MQMAMEIIMKQGVRGFYKLESGKKQKAKKGGRGKRQRKSSQGACYYIYRTTIYSTLAESMHHPSPENWRSELKPWDESLHLRMLALSCRAL
jgi:hypothetical protein